MRHPRLLPITTVNTHNTGEQDQAEHLHGPVGQALRGISRISFLGISLQLLSYSIKVGFHPVDNPFPGDLEEYFLPSPDDYFLVDLESSF